MHNGWIKLAECYKSLFSSFAPVHFARSYECIRSVVIYNIPQQQPDIGRVMIAV